MNVESATLNQDGTSVEICFDDGSVFSVGWPLPNKTGKQFSDYHAVATAWFETHTPDEWTPNPAEEARHNKIAAAVDCVRTYWSDRETADIDQMRSSLNALIVILGESHDSLRDLE